MTLSVPGGGPQASEGRAADRGRGGRHPEPAERDGDHGESRGAGQQGDGQPEVLGERAGGGGSGDAADAGAGHGPAQGRRPSGDVGEPAQPGGPHHGVAGPEREPGGEQDREAAGQRLGEGRGRHQQA
jgi:hypothetical protein